MHNFGTVLSFEVTRALKKKSFWIVSLAFPVMIAVVFLIVYLSGKASTQALEELTKEDFSIAVMDTSGIVDEKLIHALDAKTVSKKTETIRDVQHGGLDVFIYYPEDIAKSPVEVYGKEVGIFKDGRYSAVAENLLKQSVDNEISDEVSTVMRNQVVTNSTTYRDGKPFDPIKQMILPGLFLVLFYGIITFFGNQMLTVATEEKENRVIEMLLTTVSTRAVIMGKILALIIQSLLQAIIIFIPVIIGYFVLREYADILPAIDVSSLPVDAGAIAVGALLFVLSILFFTGVLVLVGAITPTAKEAGQYFGVIILLIFGPLYAVTLFVSSPESPLVIFLTLFPLTAPVPLLLRNAVGNLTGWETALGLLIMTVSVIIIMTLVTKAFKYGALEYDHRLSLKRIFRR